MLRCQLAVLQAAMLDGLAFDPFAVFEDGLGSAEVGISRCHIVEALVVTLVIVVLDEGFDAGFQIAGQEVVFQQNPVLQGLVPAFDLALGLGVERGAANMGHLLGLNVFGQITGDVAGPIVAEQPWLVAHGGLVAA
jgi:hypothetical protein